MEYQNPTYQQFVADMSKAGLEVRDYRGRNFYHGPSVDCEDIQDVIRATKVKVCWDNMGLGFVVYPR